MKYADQLNGIDFLVDSIWNIASSLFYEADYIIPVPLHKIRLRQRKYNQSALLGWKLAEKANMVHLPMVLKRIKNTESLGHLDKQERQNILEDAFIVNPRYKDIIRDKVIVLVDDVMTTGSTLMACSKVLLAAEVKRIFVVMIAKVNNL